MLLSGTHAIGQNLSGIEVLEQALVLGRTIKRCALVSRSVINSDEKQRR